MRQTERSCSKRKSVQAMLLRLKYRAEIKSAIKLLLTKVTKPAAVAAKGKGSDILKRTISAMVGKGSVNHNSRLFTAENVDPECTHLYIDYCHRSIKKVYHELFDEALMISRQEPTDGLMITIKRYALAIRRSPFTRSFCR